MTISSFHDLLAAARAQDQPQRLLFVFAGAELAEDSTAEQRARFESGEGGALVPLMSVDKTPDDIASFDALELESRQFGRDWVIVFVAAMSGRNGVAPSSADATEPLERMMALIKSGQLATFIPFDRQGQPLNFS